LIPLNVAAFIFCLCTFHEVRHCLPSSGDVPAEIPDEGLITPWRPLYTGILTVGGLALVGVLALAIGFRGRPPVSVVLVAWVVIFGGGALAYRWNSRGAR
jgi:hypothetical protein